MKKVENDVRCARGCLVNKYKGSSTDEVNSRTTFRGFGETRKKSTGNGSNNIYFVSKQSFQPILQNKGNSNRAARRSKMKDSFTLGGELKFTLGLMPVELESGQDGNSQGYILRRVLGKGIARAIRAESLGFNVVIAKLILNEVDGGATKFNVEFNMVPKEKMQYEKLEQVAKVINSELVDAMDYGDVA